MARMQHKTPRIGKLVQNAFGEGATVYTTGFPGLVSIKAGNTSLHVPTRHVRFVAKHWREFVGETDSHSGHMHFPAWTPAEGIGTGRPYHTRTFDGRALFLKTRTNFTELERMLRFRGLRAGKRVRIDPPEPIALVETPRPPYTDARLVTEHEPNLMTVDECARRYPERADAIREIAQKTRLLLFMRNGISASMDDVGEAHTNMFVKAFKPSQGELHLFLTDLKYKHEPYLSPVDIREAKRLTREIDKQSRELIMPGVQERPPPPAPLPPSRPFRDLTYNEEALLLQRHHLAYRDKPIEEILRDIRRGEADDALSAMERQWKAREISLPEDTHKKSPGETK